MDKVIGLLEGTITGVENEINDINEEFEQGDYKGSKTQLEHELEERRDFIRQMRKAIRKLSDKHENSH